MILEAILCPKCQENDIVKHGKSAEEKQRYLCQNKECGCTTFILDHSYKGRLEEVKRQVIEMSMNGSGIRDTARVLKVSTSTVINELKKKKQSLSLLTSLC